MTRFEEMDARGMFDELGYTYEYIDNKNNNSEDIIVYTHSETGGKIQFNTIGKQVVFIFKNIHSLLDDKDDKLVIFMTKELLLAIENQMQELREINE